MVAPGTALRDGLERILRGQTGALIVLGRDKIVDQDFYDALVDRAYQLGVNRPIIRTQQFPAPAPTAVLPGPATLPSLNAM